MPVRITSASSREWPHWWAILAVSLALMALVAVASPGARTTTVTPLAARTAGTPTLAHSAAPVSRTPSTTMAASNSTTTVPSQPMPVSPPTSKDAASPSTPASAPTPTTLAGGTSMGGKSTKTLTAATATTLAPIVPPEGTGSDGGSASTPVNTQQGYLQPPQNTSVEYPVTAGGSLRVAATWSSADTLTLSAICPDARESESDQGAVTVTLPVASGDCQVTLSEPSTENDTVSYSLTIGPDNGS